MKEREEELLIVQKTYDLVKYLVPRIHKFPRTYRFTVGERLEGGVLDVLERLIEARYHREGRIGTLRGVNSRLQRLRYLLRLAFDFRILAARGYRHAGALMDEVGALTGAWLRSAGA